MSEQADKESAEEIEKRIHIYEGAFTRNPGFMQALLAGMNILLVLMTLKLIAIWHEGYSRGYFENFPALNAVFFTIILLMIGLEVWMFMFIYANQRLKPEYRLHGKIILETKYEPIQHASEMVWESTGVQAFIILFFILFAVILLFGSTKAAYLLIPLIAFPITLYNFLSPTHYIFTDEGYGYLFKGIHPVLIFLGWDRFAGYELKGTDIQLLISGMPSFLSPTRIKAGRDIEAVREVVARYLPQLN